MNAWTFRLPPLLVALALAAGGAGLALAQGQAKPAPASAPRTLEAVRARMADLQQRVEASEYEFHALYLTTRLFVDRLNELRTGRRVAVVGDSRTVFMDRAAFNQSLLRHVTQLIIDEAVEADDINKLSLAADADLLKKMVFELEADALEKSEQYRRKLLRDVIALGNRLEAARTRNSRLEYQAEQLSEELARLEAEQAAREGRPAAITTQADATRYSTDLTIPKLDLAIKLETLRKAGNWSADHHMQVGTFIALAKAPQELEITEKLMLEYAGCYDVKNLRRAAVLANARTGMYKTPGERIAALDEIAVDFNACTGKAAADFTAARGRLASERK